MGIKVAMITDAVLARGWAWTGLYSVMDTEHISTSSLTESQLIAGTG